jgi:hypothetical protein
MDRRSLLGIAAAAIVPVACSLPILTSPTPIAPTSPPPTELPATITPPTIVSPTELPSGSGACTATATTAFDVYSRPSLLADVFGTFSPDFPPVTIGGRTADGWLGFEPGVAQAANIGVFRLRWIPPGSPVTLSGDCASVPIEPWVPAPGVCYQMSMRPVEVHTAADPASAVSHTLDVGEFVAVTGRVPTGWLFVNGDDGNVPGVVGFIAELEMNANGPCDSIPAVTP